MLGYEYAKRAKARSAPEEMRLNRGVQQQLKASDNYTLDNVLISTPCKLFWFSTLLAAACRKETRA
jgi:hypothetical protein